MSGLYRLSSRLKIRRNDLVQRIGCNDTYQQLALAIVLRTISRFFTGLASLALVPMAGGGQRSLAAIPRSV